MKTDNQCWTIVWKRKYSFSNSNWSSVPEFTNHHERNPVPDREICYNSQICIMVCFNWPGAIVPKSHHRSWIVLFFFPSFLRVILFKHIKTRSIRTNQTDHSIQKIINNSTCFPSYCNFDYYQWRCSKANQNP